MRVALIGYGKMGQAIEKVLIERGHSVPFAISIDNPEDLNKITTETTDVAIEFTAPEAAFSNIMSCLKNGVPVVSGSTGWLDNFKEVENYCTVNKTGFFYASNYSLGVNIFFQLNKILAKMMNGRGYETGMVEVHHTQKLDSPSGTAITLAEGMIEGLSDKSGWVNSKATNASDISIISERTENVPGTHIIEYESEIDKIRIEHIAHNRKGFALGAVLAAEFLAGKAGVYSMDDLLKF
ncbi:4-hydroxy-tetrahydrodipicolinate reductase [Reichenbachiella versicolor]|uniref:4-hydroxy-tetrahydrodipicolinate reductase n=1 Tax=Reichenbachiella versicolor TaxID=1821036 RepID=UPI000D6EAD68|nr:4-hydroxy-tetrahydrodipicolinate reductase [Reichenbachiella versicolor]